MKRYFQRFSWALVYIEFIACVLSVNNVCSLKFSEYLESCHCCVYVPSNVCLSYLQVVSSAIIKYFPILYIAVGIQVST